MPKPKIKVDEDIHRFEAPYPFMLFKGVALLAQDAYFRYAYFNPTRRICKYGGGLMHTRGG